MSDQIRSSSAPALGRSSSDAQEYIGKHWDRIRLEAPTSLSDMRKEAEMAHSLYFSATKASLPIVLGGSDIREDLHLLHNFGLIAGDPPQEIVRNLRRTCSAPAVLEIEGKSTHTTQPTVQSEMVTALKTEAFAESHFTGGSVICDTGWSLLRNDMIILGGIHAGIEFHLAMPEGKWPSRENVWDDTSHRMRVFGREIAMLCHAGYQLKVLPNQMGYIFYKPCGVDTSSVTLESCRNYAETITAPEQILALLDSVKT